MPLCTLHLISLNPQTSIRQFITSVHSQGIKPLTVSKVINWIIIPEKIDTADLLEPSHPYQLLLILPGINPLPGPLKSKLSTIYTLQTGIPSRLLSKYSTKNHTLLHPDPNAIPPLTGALTTNPIINPTSSQTLTLSPQLQEWITAVSNTPAGANAVSMLNLLSFLPNKKSSYLQYGKAFAQTIGSRRGGDAKLVGHVVYPSTSTTSKGLQWDEFALAHYPSILHFADMLASEDYQEVNQRFRVPALRDTCILCTSEVEIEEIMREGEGGVKL